VPNVAYLETAAPPTCTFIQMGEPADVVELAPDTTLGEVLGRHGLNLHGGEVFYNSTRASDMNQVVEDGSEVIYAHKIRGG
jgi:hypothetical protein